MTEVRRWWRTTRSSARLRILSWYVLVMAVALVLVVALLRQALQNRADERAEAAMVQEYLEVLSLSGGRDPATGAPFAGDVRAIFDTFLRRNIPDRTEAFFTLVEGTPYSVSFAAPADLFADADLVARWSRLTAPGSGRAETEAGPARWLAVPLQREGRTSGVFVVAEFMSAERAEVDGAAGSAAVTIALVLAGATVVAWFLAGRVLAPLRLVADATRTISESDLSRRLPVRGRDEVAELTVTFNGMLDRLQDAFAAQRDFVDDAGHELRTPITIVRGHLEVMGDDPAERRETIALVTDELDRMARIVDDLLLLAKVGRVSASEEEEIDVGTLVDDVHAKATALAERRWTCRVPRPGTFVRGDRQRLTQALVNLAANAAQHTAQADLIEIGAGVRGGSVHLWVADTGTGIAPEDHDRIFDRFARAPGSRRRSEGAGLGLAIVRAVTEAHRGTVQLESKPGRGSTFTLVVPLAVKR